MTASPLTAAVSGQHDTLGRLAVGETLRVVGSPATYAARDTAGALVEGGHPAMQSCQHAPFNGKGCRSQCRRRLARCRPRRFFAGPLRHMPGPRGRRSSVHHGLGPACSTNRRDGKGAKAPDQPRYLPPSRRRGRHPGRRHSPRYNSDSGRASLFDLTWAASKPVGRKLGLRRHHLADDARQSRIPVAPSFPARRSRGAEERGRRSRRVDCAGLGQTAST